MALDTSYPTRAMNASNMPMIDSIKNIGKLKANWIQTWYFGLKLSTYPVVIVTN